MVKKLKDVNKDGKINFKDTWLGERLTTKGKLKGPNLAESMKGARRESTANTSTMSSPKPKARPAAKPAAKSATTDAGSRVGAKDRPVKTVAELRAAKLKDAPKGTVDEKMRTRQPKPTETKKKPTNNSLSTSADPVWSKVKAKAEAEERRLRTQNPSKPKVAKPKVVPVPSKGYDIFGSITSLIEDGGFSGREKKRRDAAKKAAAERDKKR